MLEGIILKDGFYCRVIIENELCDLFRMDCIRVILRMVDWVENQNILENISDDISKGIRCREQKVIV